MLDPSILADGCLLGASFLVSTEVTILLLSTFVQKLYPALFADAVSKKPVSKKDLSLSSAEHLCESYCSHIFLEDVHLTASLALERFSRLLSWTHTLVLPICSTAYNISTFAFSAFLKDYLYLLEVLLCESVWCNKQQLINFFVKEIQLREGWTYFQCDIIYVCATSTKWVGSCNSEEVRNIMSVGPMWLRRGKGLCFLGTSGSTSLWPSRVSGQTAETGLVFRVFTWFFVLLTALSVSVRYLHSFLKRHAYQTRVSLLRTASVSYRKSSVIWKMSYLYNFAIPCYNISMYF